MEWPKRNTRKRFSWAIRRWCREPCVALVIEPHATSYPKLSLLLTKVSFTAGAGDGASHTKTNISSWNP